MFSIPDESTTNYTYLGLFSGAGGLDLGFEKAGFIHTQSSDILDVAVKTLNANRPHWDVLKKDVKDYTPDFSNGLDVLLAGFPCQGFSLGGKRDANDERNQLYREVIRIARRMQPRIIVMENVLNLRTMTHPQSGKPFAIQIAEELAAIGYNVKFQFFRVSDFGVPQTRRRFIFIAYKDPRLACFSFPAPKATTCIRNFIYDLGQNLSIRLPNHNPQWGFKSYAHIETHEPFDDAEIAIPVRFSRTASEGNPIRDFDSPFPAVDTATVWGWAKGNVRSTRINKTVHQDYLYEIPNPLQSYGGFPQVCSDHLHPENMHVYKHFPTIGFFMAQINATYSYKSATPSLCSSPKKLQWKSEKRWNMLTASVIR